MAGSAVVLASSRFAAEVCPSSFDMWLFALKGFAAGFLFGVLGLLAFRCYFSTRVTRPQMPGVPAAAVDPGLQLPGRIIEMPSDSSSQAAMPSMPMPQKVPAHATNAVIRSRKTNTALDCCRLENRKTVHLNAKCGWLQKNGPTVTGDGTGHDEIGKADRIVHYEVCPRCSKEFGLTD